MTMQNGLAFWKQVGYFQHSIDGISAPCASVIVVGYASSAHTLHFHYLPLLLLFTLVSNCSADLNQGMNWMHCSDPKQVWVWLVLRSETIWKQYVCCLAVPTSIPNEIIIMLPGQILSSTCMSEWMPLLGRSIRSAHNAWLPPTAIYSDNGTV